MDKHIAAVGRPSDDPRDHDTAGLHGVPELSVSRLWLPELSVSAHRKQTGAETGKALYLCTFFVVSLTL